MKPIRVHWLVMIIALGILMLSAVTRADTSNQDAQAQHLIQQQHLTLQQAEEQKLKQNIDTWKAVKAEGSGVSSANSAGDDPQSKQLMNPNALEYLDFRENIGMKVLALAIVGVFGTFLLFYLINGASKLSHGFSGKLVRRWSAADMTLHWIMGISCLILIITGVVMMLGRYFLADLLPVSLWAAIVGGSKFIHDWVGPLFIVSWLICMVKWMPDQFFKSYDVQWFLTAGGYINFGKFKDSHPDSGFANAGEKLWYWTLLIFGFVICVSGVYMVLPELSADRDLAFLMIIVHGLAAAVITGFTIVHIWMATALSEGGLESMLSGYCDENWAIQHHNLWYDELKEQGKLQYKT